MVPRALSETFSIAAQIRPEDLAYIVEMGFRSIICNRPDGEAEDQPEAFELHRLAYESGLKFANVPVIATAIYETDVLAFEQAFEELPKPVIAFCRTGIRSATLWSLMVVQDMPVDDIIAAALDAECDISAFRPYLEAAARGEGRL